MSEDPLRRRPSVGILLWVLFYSAAAVSIAGCNAGQSFAEMLALENLAGKPVTQPADAEAGDAQSQPGEDGALVNSVIIPTLEQAPAEEPAGITQADSGLPCVNEAAPGRPIDVNIPDDTIMQPGQEFVKTWRLINAGTCTWNSSYQVIWYWGESMSAIDSFPLEEETEPGKQTDVTVSLVAPEKPGVYQSNWKLRDPSGHVFGVGPGEGLYFYVRIIVAGTAVPEEDTLGPVVLNTPTPFAGGPTRLLPDDRIDLDRNILNPTIGEDVAMNSGDPYFLVPFESAFFSIYGKTQPTENQCLSTTPSKAPLQVDALEPGMYLCFLTDEGRTGWMRIQNFWTFQERALLNLEVYTWPLP